jgi:hypothetical protein
MTMCLNCSALRSLHLALRASLVMLLSMILRDAIVCKMKARMA